MSPEATVDAAARGVDLVAVAGWMDGRGLPGGPITGERILGGGTQNVLLQFKRGGESFVLRRGPLHLRRHSNDAIRREMQVLEALGGTDVPHPRFIAGCPEPGVLGDAVFYLMEPIDGFNPTVELPESHRGPAAQHAMGLDAAATIAKLGAIDHLAVGLGGVGKPEGFTERQVVRWLDELERYRSLEGYPGHQLPAVDEVATWLDAHLPPSWSAGIMHGDYHMANLMYRWDSPTVAAIVDWEMCTIGDPLLDLGWLLATSAMGIGGVVRPVAEEELVAAYAQHSTRDLGHVRWYRVMACFKLGIVLEGTNARAGAGLAPRAIGDMLHSTAVGLLSQAGRLVAES